MADILIKNMEMPDCCNYCVGMVCFAKDTDGTWKEICKLTGKPVDLDNRDGRPSDCPLVELPPHGRLIDAVALKGSCEGRLLAGQSFNFFSEIDNAPTVLEASNG